ncbi:MAG: hypothetical protein NVSMB9_31850 [Isosphaeraceae bacterium]
MCMRLDDHPSDVSDEVGSAGPSATLTDADGDRILVEWNDTATAYPRDACIHELFEARAREAPGSIAVMAGSATLTYEELDRRSNQVARHLRELGVGPEALVGVFLERSLESIVAFLGTLKAGGAYVPLDPTHPPARLAVLLADTRASVLLTRSDLRPLLPPHHATVVQLDSDWPSIAARGSEPLGIKEGSAENLAYVMYTSGSTGIPKGVMVAHRGVVRLLFGVDYARLGADRVFLHLAPPAFDASTFEIWGALLHGGRCVIVPGPLPSFHELGRALREGGVTTLWLTSGLYNAVIDEAPEILKDVDELLIGGEALSVAHVRRGLDRLPATRIINGYGPTEGTTFTCCRPITCPIEEGESSIAIGRPIGNTRVYLLDEAMRPVPIGVSGELFIGGDGIARGYLNRPANTAQLFVPDPFSKVPGARLYRSGDLARWRPDGLVDFQGRRDDQVKIRGYRIELGAIETTLRKCPGVRDVVVATPEDPRGVKRLVAYLTVSPGASRPEETSLRTELERALPGFMVPALFVFMDALPLTANGKVDRQALPLPDPTELREETPFTAPRNDLEAKLALAWREVLGITRIGVHDDFFRLGGNSILGLRLIARIEEVCGACLPYLTLLRATTIEQMSRIIEGLGEEESAAASTVVAIQPEGPETPFFCMAGGMAVLDGRGALILRNLAERLGPRQPLYTFMGETLDEGVPPVRLIERLASAFVADLRAAFPEGPYHLGGHSYGAFLALEMARQLQQVGRPVGLVALLDPWSPRHPRKLVWWERGSLQRKHLAQLSPGAQASYLRERFVARMRSRWNRLRLPAPVAPAAPIDRQTELEQRPDRLRQSIADHVSLARAHRYRGPVVLFRASERPPGFHGYGFDDPLNGLSPLVDGKITVCPVPGNHFAMLEEPALVVVAEGIRKALAAFHGKPI